MCKKIGYVRKKLLTWNFKNTMSKTKVEYFPFFFIIHDGRLFSWLAVREVTILLLLRNKFINIILHWGKCLEARTF